MHPVVLRRLQWRAAGVGCQHGQRPLHLHTGVHARVCGQPCGNAVKQMRSQGKYGCLVAMWNTCVKVLGCPPNYAPLYSWPASLWPAWTLDGMFTVQYHSGNMRTLLVPIRHRICVGSSPLEHCIYLWLQCNGEEIHHEGECEDTLSPACMACTDEFAPVCGVDKITYLNKCIAE